MLHLLGARVAQPESLSRHAGAHLDRSRSHVHRAQGGARSTRPGRWHRPNGRPRFYASERRAGEVAGRAPRKIGGNLPLFEAIGMTCVNILCTSSMVPRRILWSRRPSRWALQASRLISSPPPSLTLPLKHRTAPPAPRRPSCRGLHPRGPPSAPPDGSEPLSLGPAKAASERRGR